MDDLYSGKKAVVGIIGLGYVGMPLALAAWTAGFRVVGFDIDPQKAASINAGKSYLRHIPSEEISAAVSAGRLRATTRFEEVRDVDAVIICVPTPLTAHREPDLSYIESTTQAIAPHLRKGQLIVLESTTWPGTTTEVMQPILERGGLKAGRDFFLAFSPEREDPGNASYPTESIPKIVGADDPTSIKLANALYGAIVTHTIPVSSMKTAEAVKLTENIFRAVNIALVNELKVIYDAMGIDVWEVIEAAKSKPFGFMPFYPGPGLGGHCIPIDPVLSDVEGAGIRDLDALHRACRRDQRRDAELRRRQARAQPRRAGRARPSRRENPDDRHRLQEERRRYSREPGVQTDRAAGGARGRRRLF